jgi:serine/threonine protein kinase
MNQPVMDHWTTVKRIHQSALDIDPSERAAFVDESCGGDEALRREVQELLTYSAEAEAFLERPAVDVAPAPPGAAPEATLVGRTISHYQVLSLLGAGGMGEVYLARDPRLDRAVAIKILPGELAEDADRMQRFTREAKAASALNHPNVATIYDVGESDGISFIVMEHVEGETLLPRISRRMTSHEVVDIAVQTADALDLAHAKGITHRDIKPANLMVTHRGVVKVLDFGVAKVARSDEGSLNGDWTVEPVTAGSVVGSGPYMSPEQITGGDVDPRSDVFSLGVVVYQMATGHLPFAGSTREELKEAILRAAPSSMAGLNPDVPSELERITFKCLEKSAEDRYQSARELLSDLWPLKRQLVATRAMADSPRFEFLRRPLEVADESPGSEAAELIARGWAHLRSGSFFELSDAASAFVAATELAPAYAAAHAGLALTKVAQAVSHDVPHLEALAEAKTIALRALALDDKSADAQVALGQVMLFSEWDWTAAERSFQRALALNPNHAEAYLHYGGLMEALGQLTRGFELKLRGLECDSTSALAHVLIASSLWNQRRYDDVIVWVNKALDRDPRHLFARELLVGAYSKKGDFRRQIVEDLKRVEARDLSEETRGALREAVADVLHAFDHEGLDAAHRCILKHMSSAWLIELMSNEGGSTIIGRGNTIIGPLARLAAAGDFDKAFELLQGALDVRDPGLVHLAVAPQWDNLRADPRFNQCLARMKLRILVATSSGERERRRGSAVWMAPPA